MTKQEIDKLVAAKKANPEAGRATLVKLTGVSENKVKRWLRGEAKVATTKVATTAATPARGITVSAFLNKLDYPAQVRSAIKAYCGSAFIPETDFRITTHMNPTAFRQAVNTGEFADNQIKIDGIVYWSTAANIKKAKEMRGVA